MIPHDPSPLGIVTSGFGLLAGLVLTFSGYRLARGLATLAGLITGIVLGLGIGAVYGGAVGAIAAAIVLGIALALLFRFAFRFAGAVVGGLAGVAIATNLAWPVWAIILCAIAGALLGFFLNKIAIVTLTAILGAGLAVRSGAELFYDLSGYVLTMEALTILVSTVVIAAVGVLSQMRSLRGEDEAPGIRGQAS